MFHHLYDMRCERDCRPRRNSSSPITVLWWKWTCACNILASIELSSSILPETWHIANPRRLAAPTSKFKSKLILFNYEYQTVRGPYLPFPTRLAPSGCSRRRIRLLLLKSARAGDPNALEWAGEARVRTLSSGRSRTTALLLPHSWNRRTLFSFWERWILSPIDRRPINTRPSFH